MCCPLTLGKLMPGCSEYLGFVLLFTVFSIKEAGSEHKPSLLCLNKVTVWSACETFILQI